MAGAKERRSNQLSVKQPAGGSLTVPPDDGAKLKTFTGEKLDIIYNACGDVALQPYDCRVLVIIARHVNSETGVAWVSDDLIADDSVGSRRNVIRARHRLKRAGWLDWTRTSGVNHYRLTKHRESEIMDTRAINKEARAEKRRKGQNNRRAATRVTPRHHEAVTPPSRGKVPPTSLCAAPPMSPKHLPVNTVDFTPWSEQHPKKVLNEEGAFNMPEIPDFLRREKT